MMDSLAKCFNGIQDRYEKVLEAKSIYTDDSGINPLNESIKKSRCLQRAKRIDRSLRFEAEDEEDVQKSKLQGQREGLKPRKVVRFQLENNKIIEPKKAVRFDLDQELKTKGENLEEKEGLSIVEGNGEVLRVKIKMTKQEAERLLSKCKNDSVLDFEHVVDQIGHVPVHQFQVAVVVVACSNERQKDDCSLSQL